MSKLSFQKLWQSFPDHTVLPTLENLYTELGGAAKNNIHVPGFGPNGNTCASRMSVAFNRSGYPIDVAIADSIGAETLGTADGSRIIFRVSDFRKYLIRIFGLPVTDKDIPFDSNFKNCPGIVAFTVNWNGATGHIALWDGRKYREPKFDNYSAYINTSHPSIRTSIGELWKI